MNESNAVTKPLVFKNRTINCPQEVPSRFQKSTVLHLKSLGLGKGRVELGLALEETRNLADITYTTKGLPIEEASSAPWLHNRDPFMLKNLKVILESMKWECNIGRNQVYLHRDFPKKFIPAVFKHVMLPFVAELATLLVEPEKNIDDFDDTWRFQGLRYKERDLIIGLLEDVMVESTKHRFAPPEVIYETPFIRGYYGQDFSMNELDLCDQIFFTHETAETEQWIVRRDQSQEKVLAWGRISWSFREELKNRYGYKLVEAKSAIRREEDGNLEQLSDRLNKKLIHFTPYLQLGFALGLSGKRYDIPILRLCRFQRLDGRKDMRKVTQMVTSDRVNTIYLNVNHKRIADFVRLFTTANYEEVAVHYLFREGLFCADLNMDLAEREDALITNLGCMALQAGPWDKEQNVLEL